MRNTLLAAASLALALGADAARAEFFADLSIGLAFSEPSEIRVREDGGPGRFFEQRVEFHTSESLGIRCGYWFELAPWLGLAASFSHFGSEGEVIERNDHFVLSPLLMVRIPGIGSGGGEHGLVQPYAGLGPALVFSDVRLDSRSRLGGEIDDVNFNLGIDFRAGVAVAITDLVAPFIEYRFTAMEERAEEVEFIDPLDDPDIHARIPLATHHILFGVSFRF